MYNIEPKYIQTNDNLVQTIINFNTVLQPSHFNGILQNSVNNALTIRCTAEISNLYQQSSDLELGTPQRDPIPARGEIFSYKCNRLNLIFISSECLEIFRSYSEITLSLRVSEGNFDNIMIGLDLVNDLIIRVWKTDAKHCDICNMLKIMKIGK